MKERLDLEYPLATRSAKIIWDLISSDHGLERWIADHVVEEDGVVEFMWGEPWGDHHSLRAHVVAREKNNRVRFRWVDEDFDEAFWEMRIGKGDVTEQLCLFVTDYAPAEEIEELHGLWDGNLERLRRTTGL